MGHFSSPLGGRLQSYDRSCISLALYCHGNAAWAGDERGRRALDGGGHDDHFRRPGSVVGAIVIDISYHTIATWLVGL